jgi:hypothetical protein
MLKLRVETTPSSSSSVPDSSAPSMKCSSLNIAAKYVHGSKGLVNNGADLVGWVCIDEIMGYRVAIKVQSV